MRFLCCLLSHRAVQVHHRTARQATPCVSGGSASSPRAHLRRVRSAAMLHAAVWCGVVWCGVVWCGVCEVLGACWLHCKVSTVVWCGVVWCGCRCLLAPLILFERGVLCARASGPVRACWLPFHVSSCACVLGDYVCVIKPPSKDALSISSSPHHPELPRRPPYPPTHTLTRLLDQW